MADIDKSLPNEVKKTIEIEGPEKEVEIISLSYYRRKF
jgi:hypothetical protein